MSGLLRRPNHRRKGKVIPYGVYDLTHSEARIGVGIDHDTAESAAAAGGRWGSKMGRRRYPGAEEPHITADGSGGGNLRSHVWKVAAQELARVGLLPASFHNDGSYTVAPAQRVGTLL